LSRFGQPIADFHDRQSSEAVRDRDAEDRRALEHADRLDRRLAVVAVDVAQDAREQRLELLTRRRRVEDPRVEQLVEQQRMLGELAREPRAARGEVDEALERAGVLVQQREISAAPADGAIDRQDRKSTRLNSSHVKISYAVF